MEQLAFFPTIKEVNKRKNHIYKNVHNPSEKNKQYLEETINMMMGLQMHVTSEVEFAACNLLDNSYELSKVNIQYIQQTAVNSIIHLYISEG